MIELGIGQIGEQRHQISHWNFVSPRKSTTTLLLVLHCCLSTITLSMAVNTSFKANSVKMPESVKDSITMPRNVTCLSYSTKYICDCEDLENQEFQLPQLFGSVYYIEISRCFALTIQPKTIWYLNGLRTIVISNVQNLTLLQDSLALPTLATHTPLVILFKNVNLHLIDSHAIVGPIEEINFKDCRIQNVRPFALTILKEPARSLRLERVLLQNVDSQAFKKFAVEKLELTRTVFSNDVPSKFFYEIEVLQTFLMDEVSFRVVHSRAFVFKSISKLLIMRCTFMEIDAEWISADVKDSAVLRDNDFGMTNKIAFKGIRPDRERVANEKLELRLSNVTLEMSNGPNSWSLEFHEELFLNLKLLISKRPFTCDNLDYNVNPPQPPSAFLRKWKDTVYFPRISKPFELLNVNDYIRIECLVPTNYWLWITIGIIGILLVIIIIIVIVVLYRLKKKRQRLKLDIIKPEPRTYKETQIIYQIENAGLLKTDL